MQPDYSHTTKKRKWNNVLQIKIIIKRKNRNRTRRGLERESCKKKKANSPSLDVIDFCLFVTAQLQVPHPSTVSPGLTYPCHEAWSGWACSLSRHLSKVQMHVD